jgi:hypothetical protein
MKSHELRTHKIVLIAIKIYKVMLFGLKGSIFICDGTKIKTNINLTFDRNQKLK